ncbi:MAG: hypothetical protein RJB38_374 [Pseudomonadota bacterium]
MGLRSEFKAKLQVAQDREELAGIFAGVSSVPYDFIFCDYPGNAEVIGSFIAKRNMTTPLVVFTGDNQEVEPIPGDPQVVDWIAWSNWQPKLRPILEAFIAQSQGGELADTSEQEFSEIRTGLLMAASPLPADIYIRLTPTKHLKLFREGDAFDEIDYDRYVHQKKVVHLFIHRTGLKAFVDRLSQAVTLKIRTGMSATEATELSRDAHQTVRSLIMRWFPTQEATDLIKTDLMLTMQAIGKNPRLKDILKRVMENASAYLTVHSVALCQISCTLAKAVGWGSQTTFSKLHFASFFHDITVDDDELAMVDDKLKIDELKNTKGEETIIKYLAHGSKAAELSRQFNEVPPDVDQILIQHHEKPDGSGFPRKINHMHIAPLSAIFIIAHDMVDEICKNGYTFDFGGFVQTRQKKYSSGYFKKIMKAMEHL